MKNIEQQFLNELDAKLWKAADKLRSNLDAANYKHVVLGLIFLKYVSDAFEERQQELTELFKKDDEDNIYYLPREDYDSDEDYQQAIEAELEINDILNKLSKEVGCDMDIDIYKDHFMGKELETCRTQITLKI